MKNEFVLAFNEVLEEKGLPRETILDALAQALVSAYRKSVVASTAQDIRAVIDLEKGEFGILAEKEVVEEVQDIRTEVALTEALKIQPDAQLGDLVMAEATPEDFGRVAAQTARQVIQQKIREAEYGAQISYYEKQLGEIISGVVQAINATGLTIALELKAEGFMPRKEMIPFERFRIHDRVRAVVAEIKETGRGPQVVLSRTHRDFLRRLLENEVPEIFHGVVEIRSIAREPGQRAKVAVSAAQQGIDPVGACVGQRGVRIQAIVRELHDEKIDVIEWSTDPTVFISKAISPARVNGVYLHESVEGARNALVVVPEDQLSLAIGRDGQNARLAAKLTGWRIDIKSLPEAISDWLYALQNNPAFKELAESETEAIAQVEDILTRKAEGRATPVEENDFLSQFNDRLERQRVRSLQSKREAFEAKREQALSEIPKPAFDMGLENTGLPANILEALMEAGYTSAGKLALECKLKPEALESVAGVGPKTVEKIREFTDLLPELVAELIEDHQIAVEEAPSEEMAPVEDLQEGTEEAAGEEELSVEAVSETAAEGQEAATEETEVLPEGQLEAEAEEPLTFDEMFKLKPDALDTAVVTDSEEEDQTGASGEKDKKKKKKVKARAIEYDPDLDMTIARKKHKRGAAEWEE